MANHKSIMYSEERSLDIYLREINKNPILTRAEEKHYTTIYKTSEDESERENARAMLVERNQRFVVSRAKHYYRPGCGLGLMDLVNEGNLGLMRALDKFVPKKGYRLLSYASWWINQAMLTAIAEQSGIVRLPTNHASEYNRLSRLESRLEEELERKPAEVELVEKSSYTVEKVRHLKQHSGKPYFPLNSPVNEKEDAQWIDNLLDEKSPHTDHQTHYNSLKEDIQRSLALLSKREKEILDDRYGLTNGVPMTLEQVGDLLDITRERVRQIEARALRKLRQPKRATLLKSHVD